MSFSSDFDHLHLSVRHSCLHTSWRHVLLTHIRTYLCVSRKGRRRERNRKKEEPEQTAEIQLPDMEQEFSDVIEEGQPVEEENIYISDQEEETREYYILWDIYMIFLSYWNM